MHSALRAIPVGLVAGLCATVVAWYLIGDVSPASDLADGIRAYDPPALPWPVGVLAAAGLVCCVAAVVRRWALASPVVLCVLAGLLVGWAGRVMTAASIGANIGGGLMLLIGLPLSGILVLAAVVTALVIARRSQRDARMSKPDPSATAM
ncbi:MULTISPECIES: hypothetical protein [Pseudonocardia]|uniref:Tryptophan-associated transmembrane protein n=1 Tax=Pseudonocardia alni subsp. carboxydivorans TaxID=415010 RepID=A0ABU9AJD8_PSEA5|nr:hypothetical protein PaSha_17665 [Pseudonocardia alni]